MSRFTKNPSKFKNASVHVHKKDSWIHDLNVGSNLSQTSDHIKVSCDFLAFIHNSSSVGSIAILPIGASGRFSSFPLIAGHSGSVTDFDFSPFHNHLVASGSDDALVKLWDVATRTPEPLLTLGPFSAGIGNLVFHPSANNVLAVSCKNTVSLYDLHKKAKCFELSEHSNGVECVAWDGRGELLSTMSKNGGKKRMQLFDPRAGPASISHVDYHSGQKFSRVVFLHDRNLIVTSGLDSMRVAEVALWNMKCLDKPLVRHSLGSSSGSPIVLYDSDSKLLFVGVKGENSVSLFDSSTSLVPSQQIYRGTEQTKGMAVLPKRAVDVMSCEIARLFQLTQNAIVPFGYHIQRKSYSDFQADLYPDTLGATPAMTAEQWCLGSNVEVERTSLDPKMRHLVSKAEEQKSGTNTSPTDAAQEPASAVKVPLPPSTSDMDTAVATKKLNIVRSSKFRHVEGHFRERSSFINKFPSLSSTVPGDSNAFQVNRDRVAVVLSSAGGQIGIFELEKTGRLDRNSVPTLQNGSGVMDFAFDPFDPTKLIVACEDTKLRLWSIPPGGLIETLTEPQCLVGHKEKPNVLQFHPQASSLLASAGCDCQLLLWDLSKPRVAITLDELSAPLFCMAWSPDGTQIATFSKDHMISIFEPRATSSPIEKGRGPTGSRGARLIWLDDSVIAVSGFNKSSARTVTLYNTSHLDSVLSEVAANVSPATLVPHFDFDTNVLFLTGKGDSVVLVYEYVRSEPPQLFEVAPFACGSSHQAVAFFPKVLCDVSKVEIASGLRLTSTSVEGFAIRVPRTRTTYFQNDLYPDTLSTEEPSLTAEKWLCNENVKQKLCSLRPPGMKLLSEAPKEPVAAKKFVSYNPKHKTDQQKKEEILSSMIDRMGEKDEEPLPQNDMDGVDSDEWGD